MPLIDPAIRYLGRVESKAPRDFPLNQRIEFAQSPDANEFLAGVLNQVQAHLDLAPFLSGASDFVSLTPREFEHFVGATFARSGYRTTVTKASRDGGVDVIAVENVATNEGFLIQAKHTRSTVGVRVVRELARTLAVGRAQVLVVPEHLSRRGGGYWVQAGLRPSKAKVLAHASRSERMLRQDHD